LSGAQARQTFSLMAFATASALSNDTNPKFYNTNTDISNAEFSIHLFRRIFTTRFTITGRPRNALCQLQSCQLPYK